MEFNSIGYRIFEIPAYFFCAFSGAVVAICAFIILLSSKKYNLQQQIKALAISILGLVICARLFGCATGIYKAIGNGESVTLDTIKNTGIVFYGGLIGMLITYNVCIRSRLITQKDYHILDVLAVTFPLFHTIARIGCFLAGCCYGIERGFNFVLFIYLLILVKKDEWKTKHILYRYLLIYSTMRFFLEFIRGDTARGVICGISFSQVIAVGIWIFVIIRMINTKRIKEEC